MNKVNRGPCRGCGGPILYMGALFCGPGCHFAWLSGPAPSLVADPVPPIPEIEPIPEIGPIPGIEPVCAHDGLPACGFLPLEPPPDEAPKRRRIYL